MQATKRPAQRHVMMLAVVLVATWGASCLPCAHTLKLWVNPRGYFQYLITKECFGEEIALQQEKEAMQHAEYCERQDQERDPLKSKAPSNQNNLDIESHFDGSNHSRARRTLVKLARSPKLEVMLCTLRQAKLLTDDNRVNYAAVEDRLQTMKIDPQLKLNLLETVISCRPSSSSQREASSGRAALVSAMLAVAHYQGCVGSTSLSICKDFARSQVVSKLLE